MLLPPSVHQLLRLAVPATAVIAVLAGGAYASFTHFERGSAVQIGVLLVVALTAFAARQGSVGLLRRIPVRCPRCGGRAYNPRTAPAHVFACRACGGAHRSGFAPGQFLGGAAFAAVGLGVAAMVLSADGEGFPKLAVALFAQVFTVTGLLVAGGGKRLVTWVGRRFPRLAALPWDAVAGGGIAMIAGIALMTISIYDPRDRAFGAGRPPVFLAGLVFFLIGVAVVATVLERAHRAVLQAIAGVSLITGMSLVVLMMAIDHRSPLVVAGAGAMTVLAATMWNHLLVRWIPHRRSRAVVCVAIALALPVLAAALRSPLATPVPPLSDAAPSEIEFAVERTGAFPGEMVSVRLARPLSMPPGYYYWITVVAPDAPVHSYGWWQYVTPGATEVSARMPQQVGEYEVRLHADLNRVVGAQRIVVHEGAEYDEMVFPSPPPRARGTSQQP